MGLMDGEWWGTHWVVRPPLVGLPPTRTRVPDIPYSYNTMATGGLEVHLSSCKGTSALDDMIFCFIFSGLWKIILQIGRHSTSLSIPFPLTYHPFHIKIKAFFLYDILCCMYITIPDCIILLHAFFTDYSVQQLHRISCNSVQQCTVKVVAVYSYVCRMMICHMLSQMISLMEYSW